MQDSEREVEAEIFGVSRTDWGRFCLMMADSSTNFDTWEDWDKETARIKKKMEVAGLQVEIVTVNLDDFELWCRANRKKLDASSRTEYITQSRETRNRA